MSADGTWRCTIGPDTPTSTRTTWPHTVVLDRRTRRAEPMLCASSSCPNCRLGGPLSAFRST
eukprot:5418431-Alexandrium_andersonii.AAC.1